MSLIENPINYHVVCDGCDLMHEERGMVPYFAGTEEAKEDVENYDWRVWRGRMSDGPTMLWWWHYDCVPSCLCGHTYFDHGYDGDKPCVQLDDDGDGPCRCPRFRLPEVEE
ncbi:hypothetical protein LCGC14_2900540 [marine sediment metagenome]|uniref:Uncharacterized protein n=1 Tax=marine sediment metagenome TaxID=412755 RepID=A0A0F9AKP1_9ZZZZ